MGDDDSLQLDKQICFLLSAASRAIAQLYQPLLTPLGLTYTQYLVLLILWEQDGTSLRTVSEKLYLDSGTLTPLLSRLESAGLVRRERSTGDRRVVDIFLTPAGKKLKHDALAVPEAVSFRLGLPPHELASVSGDLRRLFESMDMRSTSNACERCGRVRDASRSSRRRRCAICKRLICRNCMERRLKRDEPITCAQRGRDATSLPNDCHRR
jgi:DNA-binding MarR family transcriptional regulator